ncbi:TIGR02147 family protein [Chitinispirillales bacterium ANBcel5]|uniref:TIGR02147 family protein n=1 Tax=Cellulosispirillum alkaliphilum TaxID=3039283 RepID=UPI002A58119A|nr:TIGR02147 family protein [Chitinispirillales bacterium ANBcel5]
MNIYGYDDYRVYLRDRYRQKTLADPTYSQRRFAREAGFSNPGFLNDVIKGRRKLSVAATEKMISVFSLSVAEAQYLKLLVKYNHTSDSDEKRKVYSKLVFRRNRSSFARLNPSLNKYYQDYRYPLIRTAVMAMDFRGDYEELGQFINPPIPTAIVKKCIRDLCDWGLLSQNEDGRYQVSGEFIEPPDTLSDMLKQIKRDWIVHSVDALMNRSFEKRHISTALVSVSGETEEKIAQLVETFREQVWKLVQSDDKEADRVMQLNVQFFPRTAERKNR